MQRSEAEEHLRVIRSLMEKATLYRAISAPTALVGGLLALIVGGLLVGPLRASAEQPLWFFVPWLAVLLATGAANGYFLHREAGRRGEPMFSARTKMALKALAPAHLVAGFATVIAWLGADHLVTSRIYIGLPGVWAIGYGLGLLAMEHFAPRSLVCLGWSFLLAGIAASGLFFFFFGSILPAGLSLAQMANATMMLTFGFFHLAYAAGTWPRAATAEKEANA